MGNIIVRDANGDNKYIKKDGTGTSTNPFVENVFIQDQTTRPFHMFFMTEDKTDITLTSAADKDDSVINVSAGHGFVTGHWALITNGPYMQQSRVTNVATNAITLSSPLSNDLGVSNTNIVRGVIEMNVNGSVTPIKYYCRNRTNTTFDVKHLHVFMIDNIEGDDSKYGGIEQLTNGTFIRKVNDLHINLGLYKKNQDFKHFGGVGSYTQKAGGGLYSMDFSYDLLNAYGIVFRFATNEHLYASVNDNLTGLNSHVIVATGQFAQGED